MQQTGFNETRVSVCFIVSMRDRRLKLIHADRNWQKLWNSFLP